MTQTPPKQLIPASHCGESKPSDDVKWLALVLRRGMLVIVREIERRYDVEADKGKKAA